jgi:futalosine hydrolase
MLRKTKYDLSLQAGIAGAFDRSLRLADVVNVVSERFADLGVEEADGRMTDLFDLGLCEPDAPPFREGRLWNPEAHSPFEFLPKAHGLTVSKVHGAASSIAALRTRYPDAQVESMEGAAFFYACLLEGVPFLQIRAISNYVEPRNRNAWDLPGAIEELNRVLVEIVETVL